MTIGRKLTVCLIGTTGGLSVWQANRYIWKDEMIRNRVKMMNEPPVELPTKRPEDILRIQCSGTMLNDGYILVGPRPRILTEAGEIPDGNTVYCVCVPMLTNKSELVWINRGQILVNDTASVPDRLNAWPSTCTVTGVIREPPKDVEQRNSGNKFRRAYVKEMWDYYCSEIGGAPKGVPLRPYIVDMTCFNTFNGHDKPTYPLMRADNDFIEHTIAPFTHLSYCATWTGAFMFGLYYLSSTKSY